MLDPKALSEYIISHLDASQEDIHRNLNLFQAFKRAYDQNPALVTEFLSLETQGDFHSLEVNRATYVLGLVTDEPVLITNLIRRRSQTFICRHGSPPIWTIGRDPAQSALAVRDRRLSRCHGAIVYDSIQGFMLYDLGSTNGTFVNGIRLRHGYALHDGDHVRLGSLSFRFFHSSEFRRSLPPPATILQWIEESSPPPTAPVFQEEEEDSSAWEGDETVWLAQRQAIESMGKRPKASPPPPDQPHSGEVPGDTEPEQPRF